MAGLDGVTQIAGGSKHMLALKSDGTVWVWGANRYSQLGLGDTDPRASPTTIPSLTGVTRIYAHADDVGGAAGRRFVAGVGGQRRRHSRPPDVSGVLE